MRTPLRTRMRNYFCVRPLASRTRQASTFAASPRAAIRSVRLTVSQFRA
jgi:hypothetical protein